MDSSLFSGQLVRLKADDPQTLAEAFEKWDRDSEFMRLLHFDPAQLWSKSKMKQWWEKDLEQENPSGFGFTIHTLEDDGLIGFTGLWGIQWNNRDAWFSIGIGDREHWGKGYGTDALRVVLKYAFTELNLHRVTLSVLGFNTRALRSYQKAGFVEEGVLRQRISREGQRWDVYQMGILRQEWEAGSGYQYP